MFIGSNNNDEEDDSDDEEDYSPDCESGNEDSDEDDISGLFDDSSFLKDNSKEKESTRVPDIINNMSSKVNSNTSAVTEGFARMNVGDDDFCTDFRAPFIQYVYIENDQKYIDIDFLVMTYPKKMFRPEVKDGGKEFELGIVCPKILSNKLRLTSTKSSLTNNSNQVTSFKKV